MENVLVPMSVETVGALLAIQSATGEQFADIVHRMAMLEKNTKSQPSQAGDLDAMINFCKSPARLVEAGSRTYPFLYTLTRKQYRTANATEAYCDILRALAKRHQNFWPLLAELAPGTKRNHISDTRKGVYPTRPDLANNCREVAPGWFVGTNIAGREKRRILEFACEIVSLRFGVDLVIDLPD